ncbi:MAG: helix-turn-helix transcriptional regulator [Candidatus Helarchaeota archaeon]|nr:helix-turn-helix transcriptional regulator [Candidatus Helarchaeota archaeon]
MQDTEGDLEIPDFFKKPKRTHLHFFILMLIQEKPSHGYELIKMIEERTFGKLKPSNASIYGILNYLENKDYIEIERLGKREKKIYKLTDKGEKLVNLFRNDLETFLHSIIQTFIQDDESENPLPPILLDKYSDTVLQKYSKEEQKKFLLKIKENLEWQLQSVENKLKKLKK